MAYKKLSRKDGKHRIELLKTRDFKIYGYFAVSNQIIRGISLEVKDKPNDEYQHYITKAFLCPDKLPNACSNFMLINLRRVRGDFEGNKVLDLDNFDDKGFYKIDSGSLLLTGINIFQLKENEIESCKWVDLYPTDYNPTHLNGNILVGHP